VADPGFKLNGVGVGVVRLLALPAFLLFSFVFFTQKKGREGAAPLDPSLTSATQFLADTPR